MSGRIARTHDEYLAQVTPAQRKVLLRLRATVHRVVPEATECISYQVPSFRLGRVLVGYGARDGKCALYLLSSQIASRFHDELKSFEIGRGSIHFTPAHPLPDGLLERLIRARVEELRKLPPSGVLRRTNRRAKITGSRSVSCQGARKAAPRTRSRPTKDESGDSDNS